MIAYACGSGGVMYVPEKIERKEPREITMKPVAIRKVNDNSQKPN